MLIYCVCVYTKRLVIACFSFFSTPFGSIWEQFFICFLYFQPGRVWTLGNFFIGRTKKRLRKQCFRSCFLQLVCVCVGGWVCMCVFITFHREGLFQLEDVCDILEGYGSTMLCCEYYCWCFCQVPSFPFLNNYVIFHLWRRNSSLPTTGEKTIWYNSSRRKDDILWYRIQVSHALKLTRDEKILKVRGLL